MKILLKIFLTFMKIGACSFGGGYAMIPLIKREVVENHKWLSDEELLDVIAISESTPGPIAINAATFTGYKTAGFLGALVATLGVVLPSFVIVAAFSKILGKIYGNSYVISAFRGIRIGVVVLIGGAAVSLVKKCKKDFFSYFILAAAFALSFFLKINAVFIILGAAVLGAIYSVIRAREADKKCRK